jgi:hypothetical protein
MKMYGAAELSSKHSENRQQIKVSDWRKASASVPSVATGYHLVGLKACFEVVWKRNIKPRSSACSPSKHRQENATLHFLQMPLSSNYFRQKNADLQDIHGTTKECRTAVVRTTVVQYGSRTYAELASF